MVRHPHLRGGILAAARAEALRAACTTGQPQRARRVVEVRWAEGGVVQELSMAACSGVLCARLGSL
jgi:hypothetical protein